MTLQQLEYILAVDDFRHFAKAAEHCRVTQPTLSMMIQKLEDELEVKLFDRNVQPVLPTSTGKRVIEQARNVLYQAMLIRNIVAEECGSLKGSFKLAVLPTIAPYLIPRFFPQLMEQYPDLQIQVIEMKTHECIKALLTDKVQAAIIATELEEKQLDSQILYYEEFLGYVSNKDPLFKNERIRTSDISGDHLWLLDEGHCFRDQLMRFCQLDKARQNQSTYRLGSVETFMRMVEGGRGVTFIPGLAAQQLNTDQLNLIRPFAIPIPTRGVRLIVHKDFVRKQMLSLLVDRIKESVPPEMLKLQGGEKIV